MFDYCGTCHSSEGASSNGKVCIFDHKNKLASWRWLWAAIARATQVEHIYFYKYIISIGRISLIIPCYGHSLKNN